MQGLALKSGQETPQYHIPQSLAGRDGDGGDGAGGDGAVRTIGITTLEIMIIKAMLIMIIMTLLEGFFILTEKLSK